MPVVVDLELPVTVPIAHAFAHRIGAVENVNETHAAFHETTSDEQLGAYVTRLEKDIGTTVNEEAFAQATGASSNQ